MVDDTGSYEGAQDCSSSAPPSGELGPEAAVCRCGAPVHAKLDDRCAGGHVLKGNDLALVVGNRSAAFWAEHEQARHELRDAIITDAGHDPQDEPPRALVIAADGLAQAMLIRDSAYLRMVESGGPLTSSGRTRRAFNVWCTALDRTERHVRLVGLRREPKPVPTLVEHMAKQAAEAKG